MKLPVIATLLLSIGYTQAAVYGGLCDSSNTCTDANTYCYQESDCSKGQCICNSGYLYNTVTTDCEAEKLYDDACTTSSQCVTGLCTSSKCACPTNAIISSDRRTCTYKKLGESCTTAAQCQGYYTYYAGIRCSTTCQCATGYKQVDDYTCLWYDAGETCTAGTTACGNLATCTSSTCQCNTVSGTKYEWYSFTRNGITTGGCVHPSSIKNVGYGKTCTQGIYDATAKFCSSEYTCSQCPENSGTTNNLVCLNGVSQIRASLLAMVVSLVLGIKLFFF